MAMLPDMVHAYIFNIAFPHGCLRAVQLLCCGLEIIKSGCRQMTSIEITTASSEWWQMGCMLLLKCTDV